MPIIGITCGWEPGTIVEGWPSVYVNKHLTDCVYRAGGIPLIIPLTEQHDRLHAALACCDGLILAGETMSIKHNVIEENETNLLRRSNPVRYDYEAAVIREARQLQLPILGICRGFQVLNVELGGEVTDYDINIGNTVLHQQGGQKTPDLAAHTVTLTPGTMLHQVIGQDILPVNSFHRQGTVRIAPGFIVSARSDDGNIEAFETVDGPMNMGVQFHPEMLDDPMYQRIFNHLVNQASR